MKARYVAPLTTATATALALLLSLLSYPLFGSIVTLARAQSAPACYTSPSSAPYTTAPIFAWTFDTNVTSLPKYAGSSYTYAPNSSDHVGVIALNGVTDFVNLDTHSDDSNCTFANASFGGDLTIETWAMWYSVNAQSQSITLGGPNGDADNNILLGNSMNSSDLMFEVYADSTSGGKLVARNVLSTNTWTHIVATITQVPDSTLATQRLFVNGELKAMMTGYWPSVMQRPVSYIGRRNSTVDALFNGQIDSVMLYDYALDAEAVATHLKLALRVPVYEQTFGIDPRTIVGMPPDHAQYDWSAGSGPYGYVSVSGAPDQFIDLNSATSSTLLGTSVPQIGGDGWLAATSDNKGWTFEVMFQTTSNTRMCSTFAPMRLVRTWRIASSCVSMR